MEENRFSKIFPIEEGYYWARENINSTPEIIKIKKAHARAETNRFDIEQIGSEIVLWHFPDCPIAGDCEFFLWGPKIPDLQ